MKIKTLHFIYLIWLLLLVLQFDRVIEIASLFIEYITLSFNDQSGALDELDFRTFDTFFSLIVYISVPIMLFHFRRIKFFDVGINFSSSVITLLFISISLAPIITEVNPEFHKNLNVTKHLAPLSTIKVIHLKSSDDTLTTQLTKFQYRKSKVIRKPFDDNIIFADSIGTTINDELVYFQNITEKTIKISELSKVDGNPIITSQLFLLGTDEFGRDTFTRLIYGLRISMIVGVGAVLISFILGIILGFVAGYKGGIIDLILNRVADLFLSFPVIYLVVLVLALFSSSVFSVIIVLGISGWMSLFKIVRGEAASIKQKDYMLSAKLLGLNFNQLLFKEFLPAIIAPVIVNLIYQFSNVILAESALSYLGLSLESGYPSWGAMIQSGQEYITKAWWMIVFPGVCLVITLFAVNEAGRKITKIINPRLDL